MINGKNHCMNATLRMNLSRLTNLSRSGGAHT